MKFFNLNKDASADERTRIRQLVHTGKDNGDRIIQEAELHAVYELDWESAESLVSHWDNLKIRIEVSKEDSIPQQCSGNPRL